MPWQRAGSVSVQNGNTTVTGANTGFAASSRVGDAFIGPDGVNYEIANVASDTVISILPAYKGPTIAGAGYAIMPVQGYDKMLSDAFNGLNDQFGDKLIKLGTTGNYDVLPVDKGGTGSKTAEDARNNLGLRTAALADVVGLMASGAIIESGSNANGNYTKWADGTLICDFMSPYIQWEANTSTLWRWNLPVTPAYSIRPFATMFSGSPHAFNASAYADDNNLSVSVFLGGSQLAAANAYVMAVGRWK